MPSALPEREFFFSRRHAALLGCGEVDKQAEVLVAYLLQPFFAPKLITFGGRRTDRCRTELMPNRCIGGTDSIIFPRCEALLVDTGVT